MRTLFLSPHTDDSEICAGGTMVKHVRKGDKVFCVAFSPCLESIPTSFREDATTAEFQRSMHVIGVHHSTILPFQVRRFNERRQDILEEMIRLRQKYHPDVVYMPCRHDTHQDHQVIHQEGARAFGRGCTVLGYISPKNVSTMDVGFFNVISTLDLGRKILAIGEYESQWNRNPSTDVIEANAIAMGYRCGAEFAEGFEVYRWIEH